MTSAPVARACRVRNWLMRSPVVVCVDADRKILCGWEAQTAGAQQLIEKLRVVQDALPAAKIRIFVL